jgi:hypothetical protein
MIFKEKKEEWYYRYWESEDGEFAIAIEKMLYGRIRVQILHRDGGGQLWGIQEYPTYKVELVYPQVFEIMKNLEDVSPKNGREWWLVFEKLPPKKKKYLEDKKEDPVFVDNWKAGLENAIGLRKKYSTNQ